jgi:hypothetical protein
MSLSYNYPPQMAYPSAPPVYRAFPAPPRLHWARVLVLSIVTLGVFGRVWMVVQAYWVKRVTRWEGAFWWCLVYALYSPVWFGVVFGGPMMTALGQPDAALWFSSAIGPLRWLGFGLYLAAAYSLRSVLQEEPINIPLNGGMTFFFSVTYFQYHLYDYSVEGKLGEQLSGFEQAPVGTVEDPGVTPLA